MRVTNELAEASRRLEVAERRLDEADEHEWAVRSESVAEARAQLDEYAAMQARFDDWVLEHRGELADRRILDAQINRSLIEDIVAIEHDPPAELVAAIGHPPVGVDARADWRQAAVRIALRVDADLDGDAPSFAVAAEMDPVMSIEQLPWICPDCGHFIVRRDLTVCRRCRHRPRMIGYTGAEHAAAIRARKNR